MARETLFEAVFLQFVPRASAEERINVGVVALATEEGRIGYRLSHDTSRVARAFPSLDRPRLASLLRQLDARLKHTEHAGLRGLAGSPESRGIRSILNHIVPEGSVSFVWSTTKRGVAPSLGGLVEQLFASGVALDGQRPIARRRDDGEVWRSVTRSQSFKSVSGFIKRGVEVSVPDYSYRFHGGWLNGRMNVVEPISLDYLDPRGIVEKATHWTGRLTALRAAQPFALTAIVTPPPDQRTALRRYIQARRMLDAAPNVREVIEEREVERLATIVSADFRHVLAEDAPALLVKPPERDASLQRAPLVAEKDDPEAPPLLLGPGG